MGIASVIPNGPAALSGAVNAGDVVTAVNGVSLTPTVNVASLLERQVGREVELVRRFASGLFRSPRKNRCIAPIGFASAVSWLRNIAVGGWALFICPIWDTPRWKN